MTVWNSLNVYAQWPESGESTDTSIIPTSFSLFDGISLTPLMDTYVVIWGNTRDLPLGHEMRVILKDAVTGNIINDVKIKNDLDLGMMVAGTNPQFAQYDHSFKSKKFKTEYVLRAAFGNVVDEVKFTVYDYAWKAAEEEGSLGILDIATAVKNILTVRIGEREAALIMVSPIWATVAEYFPIWSEQINEIYWLQKEYTERGEQAILDELNKLKDTLWVNVSNAIKFVGDGVTDAADKITLGVITEAVKKAVLPYTKHLIVGGLIIAGIIAGIIILPRLVTSLSHGVVRAILSRGSREGIN